LQIGGLSLGGLSLAQLLRAEAQAGITNSHKAVIMVFLSGGPPHQDLIDLKPEAPAEIRGEFKPIPTNVPGIQVCELLPGMARMMDRLALIRSVVGSEGHHSAFQCMHGRTQQRQPGRGWPSLGSTVARLQGPTHPDVPPFVGLSPRMKTQSWPLSASLASWVVSTPPSNRTRTEWEAWCSTVSGSTSWASVAG
jgi:hypothetical protein